MERDGVSARLIDMRRLRLFVAAAASVAILAGCGNGDEGTTAVPEDGAAGSDSTTESTDGADDDAAAQLLGTYWQLSGADLDDVSVDPPADVNAYVLIEEGNVEGNTGCNSFGGNAEVSEDSSTITFSQVIATKRGCSGARGQVDTAMLGVLRNEVTAEISGDTLTLTRADGGTLELTAMDEPPGGE